jgi:hypothetical protein
MVSPLEYDKKVVEEFGIKASEDVEDEVKVGYVREQLDQIRKFLWRERVELQLSEAQATSDVEALAAKAKAEVAGHRSNLKGIVASIRVLTELLHELEAKVSD